MKMLFFTQNGIFCFRTVETAIDQFDKIELFCSNLVRGLVGFLQSGQTKDYKNGI
jgi:hypothetical protein